MRDLRMQWSLATRFGLHHGHEVGPWKMAFYHGPTSMVRFKINQFTKPWGPSLGLNQVWTKRNDHAPKSECAHYFSICPKREVLKKISSLTILLSSSSLPPKKITNNLLSQHLFFAMGPCLFLQEHLFCLSHRKNPLDHVSGQSRPQHLSCGDLEVHGHSNMFS
jgi:hypothetical protein